MPNRKAVISGIGISDIGRKTANSDLDLTLQSSRMAIADAGLIPADLDGVATLGDTPRASACAALGIDPPYAGEGYDRGGLLSYVMAAAEAVEAGLARHVLVYRTVKMMGGNLLENDKTGLFGGGPAVSAAQSCRCRHQLAQHALPTPYGTVRHDKGAARLACGQ
ncbi:hypothetical protein [Sphingobium sp. Z007]|uniref:hypothetical protein n=1 Tax=Sphingobium sp. Z007 TaxID=627495 RepID=UPI001C3D9186|nr:hypothetical protein [Sphingobium sp. Z007]